MCWDLQIVGITQNTVLIDVSIQHPKLFKRERQIVMSKAVHKPKLGIFNHFVQWQDFLLFEKWLCVVSVTSVTDYSYSFLLFYSKSLEICSVCTAVHIEAIIYMRMYHCIVQ